jgi:replicative DNA helicase
MMTEQEVGSDESGTEAPSIIAYPDLPSPYSRGDIGSVAELVSVSTALVFPETLPALARHLSAEDIADPDLRLVYGTILELAAQGGEIDPITVADRMRTHATLEKVGGMHYIGYLVGQASTSRTALEGRAKVVRREARARRLRQELQEAIDSLDTGHDPEVTHSRLETGLVKLGAAYGDQSDDDLAEITMELTGSLEGTGPRGVSWPFQKLNDAVGYMVPGRVWAITAFSGGGKSAFLRSVTLPLIFDGVKVAYFSIEEKGDDVLGLMSCALMGASYTRYGQGYALEAREQGLIAEGARMIYNTGNLKLNRRKLWSPTQLLARMRQYAEEWGAQIIIIDHAHLIQYPASSEEGIWHHIAQFAIHANALAQQTNTVILAAYQPRKPGDGGDIHRPVSPDEIRGPSDIWNIVYNTLSPYRPFVEVDGIGDTVYGHDGRPVRKKPGDRDAAPVMDRFYIEPGKARIGGHGGRSVILRFDRVSGRIHD